MNKSGWKLEVFKWIFSHFRTANLNIVDECAFDHFRRVNFKKLEDEMKFCLISILGDYNKNNTGEWANNVLSIYGPKLIY